MDPRRVVLDAHRDVRHYDLINIVCATRSEVVTNFPQTRPGKSVTDHRRRQRLAHGGTS